MHPLKTLFKEERTFVAVLQKTYTVRRVYAFRKTLENKTFRYTQLVLRIYLHAGLHMPLFGFIPTTFRIASKLAGSLPSIERLLPFSRFFSELPVRSLFRSIDLFAVGETIPQDGFELYASEVHQCVSLSMDGRAGANKSWATRPYFACTGYHHPGEATIPQPTRLRLQRPFFPDWALICCSTAET
jgi:hypothetical protein